jgi:FkbM family methyltransferase
MQILNLPPLAAPPVVLDGSTKNNPSLQLIRDAQFIVQFEDIRFHVPFYPTDLIQRVIVEQGQFFEADTLYRLAYAVPEDSVVLDIGANIGNHAIYWAVKCKARKVYAFEPASRTFEILRRNVEINGLENRIITFNVAVSDNNDNLSLGNYDTTNIGGTRVAKARDGTISAVTLDSLAIPEGRCEFVKIDVEEFERNVVSGGMRFFAQMRPAFIFIEIFTEEIRHWMAETLKPLGYTLRERFGPYNLLYQVNTQHINKLP